MGRDREVRKGEKGKGRRMRWDRSFPSRTCGTCTSSNPPASILPKLQSSRRTTAAEAPERHPTKEVKRLPIPLHSRMILA
eukprot:scaffold165474_cov30-Tisochrysis_lutea.AAC.1